MKYLDADIMAMGLVFKQFNLAVPYRFGKEETLPLAAIYVTIIFGNTFLEGQIHEKTKQTTTIYTFILQFKTQDYTFAPNSRLRIQ